MADRGRDLKITVLSDVSRFDLSGPASELEDVADASKEATDDLGRTRDELKRVAAQGKDAERALKELNQEAAQNRFDELGKDAKATANKVDDAFDAIGRSAKHMDDQVDHASRGFKESGKEIRDEALDTGREMGASFSGGVDDILGAGQELLANAGAAFGPAGVAIGIALASGFGLFQKRQEELKALTDDLVERIIEGAGKLTEEGIQSKLQDMAKDGSITELGEQAERAGVRADLFARAMAGDTEAAKKTAAAVDRHMKSLKDATPITGKMTQAQTNQYYALDAVRKKLGDVAGGLDTAKGAWGRAKAAMDAGIKAPIVVDGPSAKQIAAQKAKLQQAIGVIPVDLKVVGLTREAALAHATLQDYMKRHPVYAPVKVTAPGHTRDVQ